MLYCGRQLGTAVKVNPDKEVLRLFALLGTGFDCSSRAEIEQVLSMGVDPSRIIFANTYKPPSHLRYAQRVGVCKMTFDSIDELYKINRIFPSAELMLRIITEDSSSVCPLSLKFGAPLDSTKRLLEVARGLGLNVVGVSFHVGSAATDPQVFVQAVRSSRAVFNQARELGFSLDHLDVGGGFSVDSFEDMSQPLREVLNTYFPSDVQLIAEPGRYFVSSAFTLASNIIARRDVVKDSGNRDYMLYMSDGIYGSFMDNVLSHCRREPRILASACNKGSSAAINYSIWGPTCDGMDQIIDNMPFHQLLNIGDWLYFEDMGAYTTCLSTNFNGLSGNRKIHYVSSEPAASAILKY